MAVVDQSGNERVAADALDRRLAGTIDVGDQNHICIVETGAEAFEQVEHSCVAMGLDDGDQLSSYNRARRLQDSRDLDWMMAVVIDDRHAVPFASPGKTALHALEIVERGPQSVVAECHCFGYRRRGERV